jgi:hypothetical protein
MSLKQIKLNGQLVTVMYTTDPEDKSNTCIDKVFYHELDIIPVLGLDVLERLSDEIYNEDEND